MDATLERYSGALMNTFGTPQRVLVRGQGCEVFDAQGRRYLDLLAGIAVNALGHAHPDLVSAVNDQMLTLGHISNFFASEPQIALAERVLMLLAAPAGSRVYLCNSGTEASEAVVKMARRTGRSRIIAAEGAFHGRTMGALALTHKEAYRQPFEPLPGGVEHVPFGDVAALRAAVDDTVAAIVLEPVQGEAGVLPAPAGYLAAAREIATDAGALLVLDEVQTGVGRTGAWFAHQHPRLGGPGLLPDVVTLAKGLGGGFPIGAVVALGERAATLLGPGQHGSTFGGNPVACAAALATLRVIERDSLVEHARDLGGRWRADLSLVHPLVQQVRGEGLLLGVVLGEPVAAALAACALEAGFIVNAVAADTIRLAPPLILTAAQAQELTQALAGFCEAAAGASRATTDEGARR